MRDHTSPQRFQYLPAEADRSDSGRMIKQYNLPYKAPECYVEGCSIPGIATLCTPRAAARALMLPKSSPAGKIGAYKQALGSQFRIAELAPTCSVS